VISVNRRGDRGGALLLSLVTLVVTLGFASVLMTTPQCLLAQAGHAAAKERATAAADAGIRDAIVFLCASRINPGLMTGTAPSGANVDDLASLPAGSYYPTASATPPVGESIVTFTPASARKVSVSLVPNVPYVRGAFGARGEYFYRIVARPNFYYQVIAIGSTPGAPGVQLPVTTRITAYVLQDVPAVQVPAAATFLNPTNAPIYDTTGAIVNTIYDTQAGGSPPAILGSDAGGGDPVAGVALEGTSVSWDEGVSAIEGSPEPIIGGTYGSPPPPQTWDDMQDLLAVLKAVPDVDLGTIGVKHLTYPDGVPVTDDGFKTGLWYVTIPAGTTVTKDILVINGNNPMSGIFVVDVEPNVTFTRDPIYSKNGTSYFQGAFIVNQQGPITVPADGFHFLEKNGNNPNFLQYNSMSIATALRTAVPIFTIASYVVH
jgi:hypothetical protein